MKKTLHSVDQLNKNKLTYIFEKLKGIFFNIQIFFESFLSLFLYGRRWGRENYLL